MHVEIKVAQNFVLNFLFNKLPRRRVNLFGEELESALSDKFLDHWYPDKPFKGSAFRCLRVTDPNDPVLNRAARESGNPVSDIIENLPADLAIWIDPGEVSELRKRKSVLLDARLEQHYTSIEQEKVVSCSSKYSTKSLDIGKQKITMFNLFFDPKNLNSNNPHCHISKVSPLHDGFPEGKKFMGQRKNKCT
jgi:protein Tob/BTG